MADPLHCGNCKAQQEKPYTSRRRYRCLRCNALVCRHCINRDTIAACADVAKCKKRREGKDI